ncbi:hypothetical protein QFC22_001274 [Naganishia vaughanmartiniae]|uniref:Uncharacterized protein n=1 Tax=Naganishia vaughanmartiniae TaxID=1424756 RepID=A0ACC2XGC7_9TREE|nr:hypothetical protein QFC22_001274 [Naganishia vaughanmartiniae]
MTSQKHIVLSSHDLESSTSQSDSSRRHRRAGEQEAASLTMTTLSAEDLHLLEEYKYRARASDWAHASRTTSRTEGESERTDRTPDINNIPLRNLLGRRQEEEEAGQGEAITLSPGWTTRPSRARTRSPEPELDKPVSRDYVSLRSGTPLSSFSSRSREANPPSPRPTKTTTTTLAFNGKARLPVSTQLPSAVQQRRSIRLVGSCEDEQSGIMMLDLFTPLPLEIDRSPFDVEFGFGRWVVDAAVGEAEEDGLLIGNREEREERLQDQQLRMPSRPKLVHFATTPSLSRYPDGDVQHGSECEKAADKPMRPPSRVFTPTKELLASRRTSASSYRSTNNRPFTPIRNFSQSPLPPPAATTSHGRSLSKTWTREIRASIHRDLTPIEATPQRRTRPDPALFPGVIPYSFSPRDLGLREQEKEWRRYNNQQLQNVRPSASEEEEEAAGAAGAGRRKYWSWSGASKRRDQGVERRRLAASDDEAGRSNDEWEVLQ